MYCALWGQGCVCRGMTWDCGAWCQVCMCVGRAEGCGQGLLCIRSVWDLCEAGDCVYRGKC